MVRAYELPSHSILTMAGIFFSLNVKGNMNDTFFDDNGIEIGDNVVIASNVRINKADHPFDAADHFGSSKGDDSLVFSWVTLLVLTLVVGRQCRDQRYFKQHSYD